ncbi:unnamed protein product [Caenorhabditis auriculariae]|uniref:5'-nucleotidase n=1 Tax=Caenorhabditis auriculariae TaxID=2777116 RepID=A0A8S1H8U1_9PELO|nr:unnamed protein product [Caenorhabditis auriculariae]
MHGCRKRLCCLEGRSHCGIFLRTFPHKQRRKKIGGLSMRSRSVSAFRRLLRCSKLTEVSRNFADRPCSSSFETFVDLRRVENSTIGMPVFTNPDMVASAAVQLAASEIDLEKLKYVDSIGVLLESLSSLPQVRIADPASMAAKMRQMVAAGNKKLLVISDFDFTLSRYANESGERLSTTHGVFDDNAARVDPELGKKFDELRMKYYPIEFDPKLTVEEKIPHMEAWWGTSHGYIVQSGFTRAMIEDFVRKSRVVLRDGASELMQSMEAVGTPLVIFSAGIGNVIEIFLRQKLGSVPRNVHFISNMILFDSNDKACAFSEPLIHTFCKNSSVIQKEASFFHQIAGRSNVILMGDSMGDIHMDVGVEKDGPTLRIGFYNGDVNDEASLDHYMAAYDIVLVHDSTMNVPQRIFDLVSK